MGEKITADDVGLAIDCLDMNRIWQMARIDPVGLLRKISIRQIGRKRVVSLLSLITGMDHKTMESHNSFFLLLSDLCQLELGMGLFSREDLKKSRDFGQSKESVAKADEPSVKAKNKKTADKTDGFVDIRKEIIAYLNEKTGKNFRPNNTETVRNIDQLLREGYLIEDFYKVIDNRVAAWLNDPVNNIYLAPSTLFRHSKFEKYLNDKGAGFKGSAKINPEDKFKDFSL